MWYSEGNSISFLINTMQKGVDFPLCSIARGKISSFQIHHILSSTSHDQLKELHTPLHGGLPFENSSVKSSHISFLRGFRNYPKLLRYLGLKSCVWIHHLFLCFIRSGFRGKPARSFDSTRTSLDHMALSPYSLDTSTWCAHATYFFFDVLKLSEGGEMPGTPSFLLKDIFTSQSRPKAIHFKGISSKIRHGLVRHQWPCQPTPATTI